jgi:hypothetical protein
MTRQLVLGLRLFVLAVLFAGPLRAGDLPAPQGTVILTVQGDIEVTNAEGRADFDREMLLGLGTRELTTSTIWTEGPQVFSGVPLKLLMDRLGVSGGALRTMAINDYAVTIPFSDVTEDHALLALDRNGTPMSVRDKGPIWLVYPYDAEARFRSETYHTRSIWQLRSIDVMR